MLLIINVLFIIYIYMCIVVPIRHNVGYKYNIILNAFTIIVLNYTI